jgi:hypothetical protein
MAAGPRSIAEFQAMFPDEAACAEHLARTRWPEGFVCRGCGCRAAWRIPSRTPLTFACKTCRKETSVTAGTVMHRSHLPLTIWFWAAFMMATHSNGMSALQLQKQLGIGSYKSAWLLAMKLRQAMVDPGRALLAGLVEADEASIALRSKTDPPAGGQGRSHRGKMLLVVAAEVVSEAKTKIALGRIRLAPIADYSQKSLRAFLARTVAKGARLRTDGWSGYPGAPGLEHAPHTVGKMPAHVILPAVHRVISNLKAWALGVYHGLRRRHLGAYLEEFVFRFNRRKNRHAGFATLLGLGARHAPLTYKMLTASGSTA